jgi:hypothetical protein
MASIKEYENWPCTELFQDHIKSFTPFISKRVSYICNISIEDFQTSESIVELSCAPKSQEFSGDEFKSNSLSMKLSSYIDAFIAKRMGKEHWLFSLDFQLYLSQMSIFSLKDENTYSQCNIAKTINIPSILENHKVCQVNAWINIQKLSSSLHYDENHNLAYVIHGSKQFKLISPKYSHLLHPNPYYYNLPNHSDIDARYLSNVHEDYIEINGGRVYIITITVNAGDCLFIPEGWWHQVSSEECTYSVNFWFRSVFHDLICGQHSDVMLSYFLRGVIHKMVTHEVTNWHESSSTKSIMDGTYTTSVYDNWEKFLSEVCSNDRKREHVLMIGRIVSKSSLSQMEKYWLPFAQNVTNYSLLMLLLL